MVLILITISVSIHKTGTTIQLYDYRNQGTIMKLYIATTCVVLFFTILPLLLTLKKLSTKGMSSDLRLLVRKRFLVYFCFYIIFVTQIFFD